MDDREVTEENFYPELAGLEGAGDDAGDNPPEDGTEQSVPNASQEEAWEPEELADLKQTQEEEEEPEVEEHLKDSVEGSLRLKRLLSRDDDSEAAAKKQKLTSGGARQVSFTEAKVNQLLTRWGMKQDLVIKYCLDAMSFEELRHLSDTGFIPDRNHFKKSPAELLGNYINDFKERQISGASRTDIVTAFKLRWKLDKSAEAFLRSLPHKDLRYVIEKYDGNMSVEDLCGEGAGEVPDGDSAANACPDQPGVAVMGRFNRLELIDPLADCAVFGDANLTFALALAKHRKELGHVGRVIATTFEEIDTLRERYQEIDQSIALLEEHHAEVYHGVDCTRIAIDPRFQGMAGRLGAVYYNFPHSGAIQGFFDSHPVVNWRHENLMRLFFRALRSFLAPGGIVKVSSNMSAVGVRYSYIVGSALENEFEHVETMPFLEWHLHRYGRSYGDRRDVYKRLDAKNNQSYSAQSELADMVYCFRYAPSGKTLPQQRIKMPPSLKTLEVCYDGPFRNLPPNAKVNLAKQLHERFMKEVSGTHVG